MGVVDKSQRPGRHYIQELQRRRAAQLTIKIRPFSMRPNLLGEVPQRNTIGIGQGGSVRLAGGDLPVGASYEDEFYYPTSKAFSENAVTAGLAGEEAAPPNVEGRDEDRCGF